jgi:hypothetical protein
MERVKETGDRKKNEGWKVDGGKRMGEGEMKRSWDRGRIDGGKWRRRGKREREKRRKFLGRRRK